MPGSGSMPDGSPGRPDDINDRLAEIAAELAAEGKFKEPSAAERARASARPLSERQKKRLAAELRKPVLSQSEKKARSAAARALPPAASRRGGSPPVPDRGYATPTRRMGSGRAVTIAALVVALAAVAFGVSKLLPSARLAKPSGPAAAASPRTPNGATPSPTVLFTAANPFAGSPAAGYKDGAAGIMLPAAHRVGQYTRAEVAASYATVKHLLVAALLNRPTMRGHKPTALGGLLIPQQRSWFYRHLTRPVRARKQAAWLTWRWVTAFAPDTEVVGNIVKVHGGPMTAKVVTVNQHPALQVYADYIAVYAVQQPRVAGSRLRIVAQEYATVQFAQWNDPGGSLEPWIIDFGASYADAQCGKTDGLVHPAFPALGPGTVTPTGAPLDPYTLGHRPSGVCEATTGT